MLSHAHGTAGGAELPWTPQSIITTTFCPTNARKKCFIITCKAHLCSKFCWQKERNDWLHGAERAHCAWRATGQASDREGQRGRQDRAEPAAAFCRGRSKPLNRCQALSPENRSSQGQNLAMTVLCVPCSLDSGAGSASDNALPFAGLAEHKPANRVTEDRLHICIKTAA